MSKFKLVFAGENIISFDEVEDNTVREFFKEFNSFDELSDFMSSSSIALNGNFKYAVRHTEDNYLKELFIVLKNNPLPKQYIFDTKEEALEFKEVQGLRDSVHLLPEDKKDIIKKFFESDDLDFPGFKKIKENYNKELEKAGGAKCTSCAKNNLMRKYQDIVIDALSDSPQNVFSSSEKTK
tara:strand:+ start:5974 stop:6516 length:543 start_codon:yes stop_codon:yes gene_type:complete